MKNKALFVFLVVFLVVISMNCSFAIGSNDTNIGSTTVNHSDTCVQSHGKISIDKINQANFDNNVLITDSVTDNNGNVVKNADVNLYLTRLGYGDQEYEPVVSEIIKTDDNGKYPYNYKSDTGGQLNISVNNKNTNEENKASVFIAPKSTKVSMNPIDNIDVDEIINLNGQLTDIDVNVLRYTGVGV